MEKHIFNVECNVLPGKVIRYRYHSLVQTSQIATSDMARERLADCNLCSISTTTRNYDILVRYEQPDRAFKQHLE